MAETSSTSTPTAFASVPVEVVTKIIHQASQLASSTWQVLQWRLVCKMWDAIVRRQVDRHLQITNRPFVRLSNQAGARRVEGIRSAELDLGGSWQEFHHPNPGTDYHKVAKRLRKAMKWFFPRAQNLTSLEVDCSFRVGDTFLSLLQKGAMKHLTELKCTIEDTRFKTVASISQIPALPFLRNLYTSPALAVSSALAPNLECWEVQSLHSGDRDVFDEYSEGEDEEEEWVAPNERVATLLVFALQGRPIFSELVLSRKVLEYEFSLTTLWQILKTGSSISRLVLSIEDHFDCDDSDDYEYTDVRQPRSDRVHQRARSSPGEVLELSLTLAEFHGIPATGPDRSKQELTWVRRVKQIMESRSMAGLKKFSCHRGNWLVSKVLDRSHPWFSAGVRIQEPWKEIQEICQARQIEWWIEGAVELDDQSSMEDFNDDRRTADGDDQTRST